ncbi:MAG: alpha/beta hydrolase [Actinomycetota bacterium]
MTRMDRGVLEFDGGTLAWETGGEGLDVVLLHPGLWDSRVWDEQFGVFSRTYRVLRYDLRGYGRSSRPEPGRSYSHVADLAAVMHAAGVDRAALIGNSMGGGVAVDFALTHPTRVSALVVASPALSGFEGTTEEESAWEAAFADVERQIEVAVTAGDLERAQDLRLRALWAPLGTDDPAGSLIRRIAFDNLHELTIDESGEIPIDPPAAARLGEIVAPTLVLPADHDPPWHERMCVEIAEGIRGARLVRIPETDHVIPMRRPAEFNRVVLRFLGEVL